MSTVPDAWDDDWQVTAKPTDQQTKSAKVLTRAERKALHTQENKQLWESADRVDRGPSPFELARARSELPMTNDLKPTITVLGRRPKPVDRGNTPRAADDDDSEEEARKKSISDLAERQRKAQLERQEKQRKYNEARQRLFGPVSDSVKPPEASDPHAAPPVTTSTSATRKSPQQRKIWSQNSPYSSQPGSPVPAGDGRPLPAASKKLFDPLDRAQPTRSSDMERPSRSSTPKDIKPVRNPRGPDGPGFASRNSTTSTG